MSFKMMSDALKSNLQEAKTNVLPQMMPTPLVEMKDYVLDIERCLSQGSKCQHDRTKKFFKNSVRT